MSVGEGGPHERTQPVTSVSQGPLFIFLLTIPLPSKDFRQSINLLSYIVSSSAKQGHTHHSRQKDSTKLLSQPGAFQLFTL